MSAQLVRSLLFFSGCCLLTACVHSAKPVNPKSVLARKALSVPGGLSDLYYSKKDSSTQQVVFYTLTDRGPNGLDEAVLLGKNKQIYKRPFLQPDFQPTLYALGLDRQGAVKILKEIGLRDENGKALSGRPNLDPRINSWNADEIPVDQKGKELSFDLRGIDPESLVQDDEGFFWVGEEYGPSLLKFDPTGKLIKRWTVIDKVNHAKNKRFGIQTLPSVLGERQLNRGFEAIARLPGNKLLLFLQSPPDFLKHKKASLLMAFDMNREVVTGLYAYPMDPQCGKIGAASVGPQGEILVIEQNGELGAKSCQRIFQIELSEGRMFVDPDKIQFIEKKLWRDLYMQGMESYSKIEGMAVGPQGELFFVNDNDFSGIVPGVPSASSFLFTDSEGWQ